MIKDDTIKTHLYFKEITHSCISPTVKCTLCRRLDNYKHCHTSFYCKCGTFYSVPFMLL